MRNLLLAAALAVVVPGCSKSDKPASSQEAAEAALPVMTVDELDRALADKQAQAVDCNTEGTRKRAGVVPGAILVTSDDSFAATELPADKTTKLVFYCANPG